MVLSPGWSETWCVPHFLPLVEVQHPRSCFPVVQACCLSSQNSCPVSPQSSVASQQQNLRGFCILSALHCGRIWWILNSLPMLGLLFSLIITLTSFISGDASLRVFFFAGFQGYCFWVLAHCVCIHLFWEPFRAVKACRHAFSNDLVLLLQISLKQLH